jgi:hypothetical protein
MTISIHNKNEFVDKFLTPLSRINNSCSLHLKGDKLTALVATPDASVILNAVWKLNEDNEENKLNIPDINKLIKVLDCIREEYVSLKINSNNISYNEKGVKFKYHLLEDGILSTPAINIEKVKVLKYDTSFNIAGQDLQSLIKSSTFASETDKLYIRTGEGIVYSELTDKNKSNVDSIEIVLSPTFSGSEIDNPLALSFEIIRIVSCNRFGNVATKINTNLGVLLFELNNDNIELIYVASGLAET